MGRTYCSILVRNFFQLLVLIRLFSSGNAYYRRYTKFYGTDGTATKKIAADALKNYPSWIKSIEYWQTPVRTIEFLFVFFFFKKNTELLTVFLTFEIGLSF